MSQKYRWGHASTDRFRIVVRYQARTGATSHVLTGRLVTAIGEFGRDVSTMAVIYLLGLVALLFAPETKRRRLPD